MRYSIRHDTQFYYDRPVHESVTEVKMRPRSEGIQRCIDFSLSVQPEVRLFNYVDYLGNTVHHFNVPAAHKRLFMTAEALVELNAPAPLPDAAPDADWTQLDGEGDPLLWDFRHPSRFVQPTSRLKTLGKELRVDRNADPLSTLRQLNESIYNSFDYAPQSTGVESSIDEALEMRRGVCQDFTHIMIALVRLLGIPGRYVSGYLFHRYQDHDRSAEDATHAWMEAWLPELGWIGFDPTNNLIAAERHIRVAVGRDYADVAPTRGTFKGKAEERLSVGVRVLPAETPIDPDEILLPESEYMPPMDPDHEAAAAQQQ